MIDLSEKQKEKELIRHLRDTHDLGERGLGPYYFVNRIAGTRISPDIDMLTISSDTNYLHIVNGYEFKLLHYKTNAANYKALYQGVGQALLYFWHGLDRSYLVLGVSKEISEKRERQLLSKLYDSAMLFEALRVYFGFNCFGVYVWRERDDSLRLESSKVKGVLPWKADDIVLKRQNLLKGNFDYRTL
jgi:hypothetical protein